MIDLFNNTSIAGWFLNFFILTSVFILALWVLLRFMRPLDLPLRSAIAVSTMICIIVIPLMFTVITAKSNAITLFEPVIERQTVPVIQTPKIEETTAGNFSVLNFINAAGLIWVIGFLILFIKSMISFFRIFRMKKNLVIFNDDRIKNHQSYLKGLFQGFNIPPVCKSSNFSVPMTIGFFKPVIVIPETLYNKIDETELKAILIHEIAHVIHRDNLMLFMQKFVVSLAWFHPLVYRVASEFSEIREHICDNYGCKALNPKKYAESLINLAEKVKFGGLLSHSLNMASDPNDLKLRIKKIVSKENKMRTKTSKTVTMIIFFLTLLLSGFIASQKLAFARVLDIGVSKSLNKTNDEVVKLKESKKGPKILKRVKPEYPKEALQKGISGSVVVKCVADKTGRVNFVSIEKSDHKVFNTPALEAVKQWLWEPYLIDGVPRNIEFIVKLDFDLKHGKKTSGEKKPPKGAVESAVKPQISVGVLGGVVSSTLKLEGTRPPSILKRVKPIFPEEAKQAKITGRVVVKAVTDIYGKVVSVQIVKSPHSMLDEPCIAAIKQWLFEPYIINGKPQPVEFVVKLDYKLAL